jgi:hypothetical protein
MSGTRDGEEKLDDELLQQFMDRFLGYGETAADFCFIGMEEGGGKTIDEVRDRLRTWADLEKPKIVDLHLFHSRIGADQYFEKPVILQGTWKRLIRLVLTAQNGPVEADAIRDYQANRFGRSGGETSLLELLPLPSPGIRRWNYSNWSDLPKLRSRKSYEQHLVMDRIAVLKSAIRAMQPRIVVFYGLRYLKYWQDVAELPLPMTSAGLRMATRDSILFMTLAHPAAWGRMDAIYEAAGREIRTVCW